MRVRLIKFAFFSAGLSAMLQFCAVGNDWPNWLGPNYNGTIEVPGKKFDQDKKIELCWTKAVGVGWSAPIVYYNKVFLHDRVDNEENLTAFDKHTGERIWHVSFQSTFRDDFGMENGPRSTPALSKDIIITHSPSGFVHAISAKNGKVLWTRDLDADYASPKGFFGRCSSPLVLGERVFFDVGGKDVGLIAMSLHTGETIWTSKAYTNDYASLVPLRDEKDIIVAFMREGLVLADAETGKEVFHDDFRSPINASVNAASPLVIGDGIFLSSCYDVGARFWKLSGSQNLKTIKVKKEWQKHGILDCHFSTPVYYGGNLFGFHGRQERGAELRCIKLSDQKILWNVPSLGAGHLIRVGEEVICLTERGELIVFSAQSSVFNPILREQVLGPCRAHFAYSDGKVFARDKRRLICLNLFSKESLDK